MSTTPDRSELKSKHLQLLLKTMTPMRAKQCMFVSVLAFSDAPVVLADIKKHTKTLLKKTKTGLLRAIPKKLFVKLYGRHKTNAINAQYRRML